MNQPNDELREVDQSTQVGWEDCDDRLGQPQPQDLQRLDTPQRWVDGGLSRRGGFVVWGNILVGNSRCIVGGNVGAKREFLTAAPQKLFKYRPTLPH